jgi:hypothetical protein
LCSSCLGIIDNRNELKMTSENIYLKKKQKKKHHDRWIQRDGWLCYTVNFDSNAQRATRNLKVCADSVGNFNWRKQTLRSHTEIHRMNE